MSPRRSDGRALARAGSGGPALRRAADFLSVEELGGLLPPVRGRWVVLGVLALLAFAVALGIFRGLEAVVSLVLLLCALPVAIWVGRRPANSIATWALISGLVAPFLMYPPQHPLLTFDRVWLVGVGASVVLVPMPIQWAQTARGLAIAMAAFCIAYGGLSAGSAVALHELGPLREWVDAILLPTLLFIATARVATQPQAARRIVYGIIGGGAIIALIAIGEAIFGFELATRVGSTPRIDTITGVIRVSGPYPAPEVLALTLLVCVAITLYWTQTRRDYWHWVGWVVAALQVLAIVLTYFRAAWLGVAIIGVGSFAIRPFRLRRLVTATALATVGGLIALGLLVHVPVFARRLTSDFALANIYVRVSTDLQSLQLFARNPLFGVGTDQYTAAATRVHPPTFLGVPALTFPHSSYLGLLAEQGFVGFAPFVVVTVLAILAIREMGRTEATRDDVLLYAAAASAGIAYFVMAVTLTMLPYEASNGLLALLLGLVCGRLNARTSGVTNEPFVNNSTFNGCIDLGQLRHRLSGRSWILLFGGSRKEADELADTIGTAPVLVAGKRELLQSQLRVLRRRRFDAAVLLSPSWRLQRNRALYGFALAATRAKERFRVDGASQEVQRITASVRLELAVSLPADAAEAVIRVGAEAAAFELRRRRSAKAAQVKSGDPRVLALWTGGDGAQVGGSVTHISGILKGLRANGAKVGLVSADSPPPQLEGAIDDIEIIPAPHASARLTGDVEKVAVNGPARIAGMKLAQRLRPTFVYQRHQPFLTAGCEVASSAGGVPLALEWNASEVWVRANWGHPLRVKAVLNPFLAATERYAIGHSSLIAAVSEPAAKMAIDLGAPLERVITLPNAVDVDGVERALSSGSQGAPAANRLGWIGTFGPWHGAEVAIQALARLPAAVELLLIGDGDTQQECRLLAASLGIGDRVTWTGTLPHDEAVRRLATCSILLSPHVPLPHQEFFGSPTKLFEYMAIARPIVASRLGQIGTVLVDGETALLVTPGDPDDLAAAISRLVEDRELGLRLARAARTEVEAHHTWKARANQLLTAIENGVRTTLS